MSQPPIKTRAVRTPPPALGRAVTKEIGRLASASGAMDPELAEQWPEMVGPELAALCRPVAIKKQGRGKTAGLALVVAVANGAAAMRVEYAQGEFLARASSYLKMPRLKRLMVEQSGAKGQRAKSGRRWSSRNLSRTDAGLLPPAEPPAASVAEALERLRRSLGD